MKVDYKKYHRDDDYIKMSSTLRNIFLTRYKIISKFVKKGRVLEVGSSTGEFLNIFKEQGYNAAGVEPSKSGAVADKRGIKVYRSYFEKAKLPRGYFDLIIFNHTLEHVEDPKLVLSKANTILKKGGYLYVDVPNAGGLASKLLGKYWPYRLPEEHITQFTRQKLFDLFKKTGFEVEFWDSKSGFFEYSNPILELGRKSFYIDLLLLPYSILVTTFKIGDSITVIGKKL